MKNFILLILLLCTVSTATHAQEQTKISKRTGLGFHLSQYQRDFGLGLSATTPFFANEKIAFRLRANLMWHEHLDGNSEITWTGYSNMTIGVVSTVAEIGNIRLYGEGGAILLLPSSTFSSEDANWGGYGLFGFEFFFAENFNYFIEIGGIGSGAKADKIPSKPIYSNGLLLEVGFRLNL